MPGKTIVTYEVEPPVGEGWDERICAACGDEIEPNQESVERRFTAGEHKMVEDIHTWCALKDGDRVIWKG